MRRSVRFILAGLVLCLHLLAPVFARAQTPVFSWAAGYGGTNVDSGNGIAVDPAGNVYVSGHFDSPGMTCGQTHLVSRGGYDVFLAKFDRQGGLLWVRQDGGTNGYGAGTSGDACYSAATDGFGHVYIAGYFNGTATFGNTPLTSRGDNDIYVAKYDGNGQLLWARRAGGAYHDTALRITVDASGNCYVPGFFRGDADFGATNLANPSTLYSDLYLAKYDPQGNVLWVKQGGGDHNDVSHAAAVDASGNVFITGYFRTNAMFDGISISGGQTNMFAAKYDGDGRLQWVRAAGGDAGAAETGRAVVADNNGGVYVAGIFQGTAVFGSTNLVADGGDDLFVAQYDGDGNLLWAVKAGGAGTDSANSLARDNAGDLYLTGSFTGNAAFGPFHLTAAGDAGRTDLFVAKLDGGGRWLWAVQAGGSGDDAGNRLAVDATKTIFLAGTLGGGIVLNGEPLNHAGATDVFVSRLDEIPVLSIVRSDGMATLSWPTTAAGFVLQSADSPGHLDWRDSPRVPGIVGSSFIVETPLSGTASFYRLSKP